MTGPNPLLTKSYVAAAPVGRHRLVTLGGDAQATQASAATQPLIGVAAELDAVATGRVDVHMAGIAHVTYGAAVTRGDLLTADANGKAIPAAPAAGVTHRVIGPALMSGAADDVGTVLIAPGVVQGTE